MTFGEFLWDTVLLQSIGVVGLLFGRKHTAQTPAHALIGGPHQPAAASPRERIRTEYQLRALNAQEEGLALRHLPVGVYGFTYAPLSEAPLFRDQRFHSFELHKPGNGRAHLLAFVTPSEAGAIALGAHEIEVRIYPDVWEDATEMVSIPVERLRSRKMLSSREPGNWISCTVLPLD
jgi:hypothetical protein